ncbi:sigma 54-interacting transcriptional regulator [Haliangium ochraceum]|uniref:Sigma54 specific transcriptional regulator, Fis family n=1 Tax=Haliangium ochraceum (strain DSM 14365 / JCM 11303 / SMP-2) TaxID=502025 RepID=D0LMF3_HALO1|nr:sigma 54-interacting transcriptional regulator [Haliangium ochraceum]ACY16859.1 sigma54 specific transcriptional regulator, Fis family [Haliangium ochraceum DSM 14365]
MSDTSQGPHSTAALTETAAPPLAPSVRGFQIDVEEGPSAGLHWESSEGGCSIGSHPACDVSLEDRTVSRFHCEIAMTSAGPLVRDLDSRNGTLVDGTRVLSAYLRGDSRVHVGRSVLRFRFLGRRHRVALSTRERFGLMVGTGAAMRATFALLEKAAAREVKVLLEGETGTGKSMAARSLHLESARKERVFLSLNCGAVPANLLESELFGHVKSAFTGATDRAGLFEAADGGTLFLDEIGEMPLDLQVKLLTVLDEGAVRRIGENRTRAVDVRVLAATNRDLRTEVNAGRFREDLYYRLAVLRVRLPALRERPEDLPALARAILSDLAGEQEDVDALLGEELLEALRRAAWPGNIRELRNYLEQYMVFEDLPPLEQGAGAAATGDIAVDASQPFAAARKRVLAEFERLYVRDLMQRSQGKISQAAESAGIDRTYLYRLRQRYGL